MNKSYSDYNIIKGRMIFEGNLKLPVELIESGEISEKDLEIAKDVIMRLKDRLLSDCQYNADYLCKIPLSFNKQLIVDYCNNKLNLYIQDDKENIYTQTLTKETADHIVRKEAFIIKSNQIHAKSLSSGKERRPEILEQKLVHSAYESKTHNRGSPTVFGRKIGDDFDLDR